MLPGYGFVSPQSVICVPSDDTFCQDCDNFRQICEVADVVKVIRAGEFTWQVQGIS
jgi:hypothetical protein